MRAYVLLLARGARGGTYNIGSGTAIPIGDVLAMLCGLAQVPITVENDPNRLRPSDVPVMMGDTTVLRQATGWQPEIPLAQSLSEILAWWRAALAAEGER